MTRSAFNVRVFPQKRILRRRVIELRVRCDRLPGNGGVAALAALLEESTMRVGVTGTALLEGQAGIFDGAVSHCMALLAGHIDVGAGQREPRFGVIEFACHLPVGSVVAAQAIASQASLVLVFVAGGACRRQSQEGSVQIFRGDQSFLRGRDSRTVVALCAFQACVFPVEFEAGCCVVECPGIPANDLKIRTVVFRMAANAIPPSRGRR